MLVSSASSLDVWDDYDFVDYEGEAPGYVTPDPMVLQAAEDLRKFFARRRMPFYLGQLECIFEKQYFHWITYSGVQVLIHEGFLDPHERKGITGRIIFVARTGLPTGPLFQHIKSALHLLEVAWNQELSDIRGKHLEALVKAELRANGFTILGTHTRAYKDQAWTKTDHTLDFVAELENGKAIGVEVKNTIPYIPQKEFEVKLEMCRYLGVRPVFAVRWMPKNYIWKVARSGGFGWLFEHQAYPLGYERLCKRLQSRFQFPAKVMTELPGRSQQLFSNWVRKLRS